MKSWGGFFIKLYRLRAYHKFMSKEKVFVRSNSLPGVYGATYKGKLLEIKDREMFPTSDPDLIKIFKESKGEIIEFKISEEGGNEVLDYLKMKEVDLLKICKKRNLLSDDITVKDFTVKEFIDILQVDDEENSKLENDPGEQAE